MSRLGRTLALTLAVIATRDLVGQANPHVLHNGFNVCYSGIEADGRLRRPMFLERRQASVGVREE